MVTTACDFLQQHNTTDFNNKLYKEHEAARSAEELNLQTVLLATKTTEISTIKALLVLAEHQDRTRPRTEVIEYAVQFARECHDQMLLADTLFCYGNILYTQNQKLEALEQFYFAREIFLAIPALRKASATLLNIAQASPTNKLALLEQAQLEFESLDNQAIDTAFCLLHLGMAHYRESNEAKAVELLMHARAMVLELGGWPYILFECEYYLSWSHYDMGQYDEAEKWGWKALENQQNDYDAACSMEILGKVSISKGEYDQAIGHLLGALEVFKTFEVPVYITRMLLALGRAKMKKGQKQDALQTFTEALGYSQMSPNERDEQILCQFYLNVMQDPWREPTAEEINLVPVNDIPGRIHLMCDQGLERLGGDASTFQNRLTSWINSIPGSSNSVMPEFPIPADSTSVKGPPRLRRLLFYSQADAQRFIERWNMHCHSMADGDVADIRAS
ncbi:hypothetical protein C8J56DRAFT_1058433 [Mycena floridula]|nr:hypothetical protein C8J56DRAFT_1058433 [Mycena floridula]